VAVVDVEEVEGVLRVGEPVAPDQAGQQGCGQHPGGVGHPGLVQEVLRRLLHHLPAEYEIAASTRGRHQPMSGATRTTVRETP
jgi:hypothetical protein